MSESGGAPEPDRCEPWPIAWPCDPREVAGEVLVDDGAGDLVEMPVDDVIEAAVDAAVGLLWSLTGRRLGVCTVTETYRVPWEQCAPGRRGVAALQLRRAPIVAVDEVRLHGILLDPGGWEVREGLIYRLGGVWPIVAAHAPAPIEVLYHHGVPIGSGTSLHNPVRLAVGEVACEVLRGLTGADCRLPSNAVSVTRNGVTIELGDAQTLWEQGRTGMPFSDNLIRQTNPHGLTRRPRVVSPDLPRRAR